MTSAGLPLSNNRDPLSYVGPKVNIVPIQLFPREPNSGDTRYPIGQMIIIGRDPISGTEGDLWYLSEFDSSGQAVWLQLLTGAGSPGVDSITTDQGSPAVLPDGVGNINIIGGTGITVTGQGPGDTVTINGTAPGIEWSVVTGTTQNLIANEGYFANNAGGVTFTLPATASVGDTFAVSAINAGGWTVVQNAGQDIR